MVDSNVVFIGFLNVVASPHPDGIYRQAIKNASNRPVRYRGRDWAVILPPKQNADDPNLHEGIVSIWTDVDASEPSIDKTTFQASDVGDELKKIFSKKGFNNRGFNYVLDEKTHKVAIELKNELGKTLSARLAGKIFQEAFSKLNNGSQTFEITVQPTEDALDFVLGLARIDKIHISLKRPNPGDHHGDDAEEILEELESQNLKSADYEFARQPGTDGIQLNQKNRVRAEVAAENGKVDSSGLDENEQRAKRSTSEYPMVIKRTLAAGTGFLLALRDEVKKFRAT